MTLVVTVFTAHAPDGDLLGIALTRRGAEAAGESARGDHSYNIREWDLPTDGQGYAAIAWTTSQ